MTKFQLLFVTSTYFLAVSTSNVLAEDMECNDPRVLEKVEELLASDLLSIENIATYVISFRASFIPDNLDAEMKALAESHPYLRNKLLDVDASFSSKHTNPNIITCQASFIHILSSGNTMFDKFVPTIFQFGDDFMIEDKRLDEILDKDQFLSTWEQISTTGIQKQRFFYLPVWQDSPYLGIQLIK